MEYRATLTRCNVLDLVAMTPSARHVSGASLTDDDCLPDRVTVSVLATAYRPRGLWGLMRLLIDERKVGVCGG